MIDDSGFVSACGQLPGAVGLIVDREGTRYGRALGLADVSSGARLALDTPVQIASMTKPLVSLAALQLVEAGRLELDAPVGALLPELAEPRVLTGFDAAGQPRTRPAKCAVTLRHLLTHTAGCGYFFVHPEVPACLKAAGMPAPGTRAALDLPLLFDPGERWDYSVATDWVGLAIEAVTGRPLGEQMAERIFAPLGMAATHFPAQLPPGAARIHQRLPAGGFKAVATFLGSPHYHSGGGGLISTAPDYARFVRAMLRGGELDGQRILSAAGIAEMARNQIGPLRGGAMGSQMPGFALPFDSFPGQHTGWGLGFAINPEPGPHGRSPGSLSWTGVANTQFWIDPAAGLGGVFVTQLSPFADPGALAAFAALERIAYG